MRPSIEDKTMKEKFKHLRLVDRQVIESYLNDGKKLVEISNKLGISARTISKEISRNRIAKEHGTWSFLGMKEPNHCSTLDQYPYVCNHCKKKQGCLSGYTYYYKATKAQSNYEHKLKHSRAGLNLDAYELDYVEATLNEGLSKGQSIAHIIKYTPDFPVSLRTVYRYIDEQLINVPIMSLRRKVSLRKRKKKKRKTPDLSHQTKRTFTDYNLYYAATHYHSVEMDSVIGKRLDAKRILTFLFVKQKFLYAILLDNHSREQITKAFDELETILGHDTFKNLFPTILTDRGYEFSDPDSLKLNDKGQRRTSIFYCDPQAPHQKGAIEQAHKLLRYKLPKSRSFDTLTQDDLYESLSHINSYTLNSIGSLTPYTMMAISFGTDILKKLKVREIDPDLVDLNPII